MEITKFCTIHCTLCSFTSNNILICTSELNIVSIKYINRMCLLCNNKRYEHINHRVFQFVQETIMQNK